jgi:hypothetical protein
MLKKILALIMLPVQVVLLVLLLPLMLIFGSSFLTMIIPPKRRATARNAESPFDADEEEIKSESGD